MRNMTVAFALKTASVLCLMACLLGTLTVAAQARTPRTRLIVRPPPVVTPTPYWDSYIVPRYRYRPEDDRVDPYGPPVVPVIRYGNQEVTLPRWWYW